MRGGARRLVALLIVGALATTSCSSETRETMKETADKAGEAMASAAEEIGEAALGLLDIVIDFLTGRTDPPSCPDDAPGWASFDTEELSSLHVCGRAADADDGSQQFRLGLASNRRTAQIVVRPDAPGPEGAPEIEIDRPDVVGRALARLAGVDADSHVVLLGEESMSLTFQRPLEAGTIELRAEQTWPLVVANALQGVLSTGIFGAVPADGTLALLVVGGGCLADFADVDPTRLDLVPDGIESTADFLERLIDCGLALLEHPTEVAELATSQFAALGFSSRRTASLVDDVLAQAKTLQSLVPPAMAVIGLATGATSVWDAVFDNAAESRIVVDLVGAADGIPIEDLAPCAPGCVRTGGVVVEHPAWGRSHLVTYGPATSEVCSGIAAALVDSGGELRWHRATEPSACFRRFAPAGGDSPGSDVPDERDGGGRLFLDYGGPEGHNGVVVLTADDDGVDDGGSMPVLAAADSRFDLARAVDLDGDDTYEIVRSDAACAPSCPVDLWPLVYRWGDGRYSTTPLPHLSHAQ